MNADDFVTPSEEKAAELNRAKDAALTILSSVKSVYEKLKQGAGNPAFLSGKSAAYMASFRVMARALGIREEAYMPVVQALTEKLRPYWNEHEVPLPKATVVIQHLADPHKTKVEEQKASMREKIEEQKAAFRKEEAKRKIDITGLPNEKLIKVSDVANALHALGYSRSEAKRSAEAVYKDGASVEDMISEACQTGV